VRGDDGRAHRGVARAVERGYRRIARGARQRRRGDTEWARRRGRAARRLARLTRGREWPAMANQLFDVAKPVIAMVHFPALPGSPRHRRGITLDELVERVRGDLTHLLDGGVDSVMFC